MEKFLPGQVVTVFRSRLDDAHAKEYAELAPRIAALAGTMPGLVDVKSFQADDGERVTIVTFADEESHRAWRDHPEHRRAQELGRSRYYSTWSTQVSLTRWVGGHL